jgi:hypothetical protein
MKDITKLILAYLVFVNNAYAASWVSSDGMLLVNYESYLHVPNITAGHSTVVTVNVSHFEELVVSVNGEFTKPFSCRRSCKIDMSQLSGFAVDQKNVVGIMRFKKST